MTPFSFLVSIQDVDVLEGNYQNAIIIWYLDPEKSFTPLIFGEKESDLGITLPISSDTNGYAVTEFEIYGFDTGEIAGGDIDASTGNLNELFELLSIETPVPENQPPVADAGLDQTVECSNPVSTEVTLDGSCSSDPDDDPITYTWTGLFPEGGGTVVGVNPTVTLPLGEHTITLVVNDGELDSEPDEVSVTITIGVVGLLPPLAALVPEGDPVPSPDKALKCGRTIPVKLQLFCGETLLSDADVSRPEIIVLVRTGDAIYLDTVDLDVGEANDSGWLFRFVDNQWVYCLCTKNLEPGNWLITIEMPDGRAYSSGFVLR